MREVTEVFDETRKAFLAGKYQNAAQPLSSPLAQPACSSRPPPPHQPNQQYNTTMSSVGVKRKLPPPPGSPAYIAAHGGERGDGRRNTTATGRGGGRGRRGRGRGTGRGRGRGQAGRGGAGAGSARVRGERAMDRQLGQDAPPPESLHKYVRGPGNSTEVRGCTAVSVDSSCTSNASCTSSTSTTGQYRYTWQHTAVEAILIQQ